ncbi:MAG: hypothetical protein IPP78_11910 [Holophagaceae bacterium]|nr:hypothetical protein [Holophagaceae bacterium]
MYFRRGSIVLLVSSGLLAQAPDAWETLLSRQRIRPNRQGAYQFISRGQDFEGVWSNDLALTRLRASGELSFLQLDEAQSKALWSRQRWASIESHWAILGPTFEIVASGTSQPTAESLLQTLRDVGWKPQSERRAAFLREHPDNGDAWQDLFTESLNVAMRSGDEEVVSPDKEGETKALDAEKDQARFGDVDRALRGLLEVERWEHYFEFQVDLNEGVKGFAQSSLLQPMTVKMRRGVEDALKVHPGDERLWSAWSELAGPGDSPEALLASLDPAPRQPWPPLDAAEPLMLAYRRNKDWVGLARVAEAAMTQALHPLVIQASAGDSDRALIGHRATVVAAWGPSRVEALLHLGRVQEALSVLEECRAVSGRVWRRVQQVFGKINLGGELAKTLRESDQRALMDLIKLPAAKDAPPPAAPLPLRLAVQGKPYWKEDFIKLQQSPAFDIWSPGRDLVWEYLGEPEARLFKDRGEGGANRWVLLQGQELLSSGGDLPTPETLSGLLRAQGDLPYLAELDAFIRAHPDHMEAREQRISEVAARPQTPGLEKRLLADLTRTRVAAILPKDWKPDKELWAEAAQKMLPQLEADVRRWPTANRPMLVWVTWASLLPSHPKPGSLLRSLAIWKNIQAERDPVRTGPLNIFTTGMISEFLESHKDWEGLSDWCQALWELGWREALPRYLKPMPGLKEAPVPMARWFMDVPFRRILQPWAVALRNLGRAEELRQLALELDLLQPGLAKRLDAPAQEARPSRR